MAYIHIPKQWHLPGRLATPENVYLDRRTFLRGLGLAGIGAAVLADPSAFGVVAPSGTEDDARRRSSRLLLPRPSLQVSLDRDLTDETVAAGFNAFCEFSDAKDRVAERMGTFAVQPWRVDVTGLVRRPRTYDIDELRSRMPVDERLYRFRCVEGWAMAIPWIGFPLSALLEEVEPLTSARFVTFVSRQPPDAARGPSNGFVERPRPWPYTEGLTIAEAMNDLTLMATGMYGHPLAGQHGAPIRLVTPWKYGFKSIKSVVRIELTAARPATFWNTLAPQEYDFFANVDPSVPHPRWSQATEHMVGTGERRLTLPYNGYGDFVASLYG